MPRKKQLFLGTAMLLLSGLLFLAPNVFEWKQLGEFFTGDALKSGTPFVLDNEDREAGTHNDLELDASGRPVIAYSKRRFDGMNIFELVLLHCGNSDCSSANVSSVAATNTSDWNTFHDLELDASGFPVVAYVSNESQLRLLHCNDVNCAGANESNNAIPSAGIYGSQISMELDASGFPVIAGHDVVLFTGPVLTHCDDANCAGDNESVQGIVSVSGLEAYTSLQMDASGFPTISYYDGPNGDLRFIHCNDANCAGGNEAISTVESTGNVGKFNRHRLNSSGNAVIVYMDATNLNLKIATCQNANCSSATINTLHSNNDAGYDNRLTFDASGYPIITYRVIETLQNKFYLLHCNDTLCAGGDEEQTEVSANAGDDTLNSQGISSALNSNQEVAIAFFHSSASDLYFAMVSFNSNPSAPSSLGPSSVVNGSTGIDTTPTLSMTLSDSNISDTLRYRIQIDDQNTFSSPLVDYTSALAAQGSASFTVGQAAGSGSYTIGSVGQTLSAGSYYWRVKAIDSSAAESDYSTANSGAVAFVLDTTAPGFTVQYHRTATLDDAYENPPTLQLGVVYYLGITASETLTSPPSITINAEGTANDITDAITALVSGTTYRYSRTIVLDTTPALGQTQETITITGTDVPGNTALNVAPLNQGSNVEAYLLTVSRRRQTKEDIRHESGGAEAEHIEGSESNFFQSSREEGESTLKPAAEVPGSHTGIIPGANPGSGALSENKTTVIPSAEPSMEQQEESPQVKSTPISFSDLRLSQVRMPKTLTRRELFEFFAAEYPERSSEFQRTLQGFKGDQNDSISSMAVFSKVMLAYLSNLSEIFLRANQLANEFERDNPNPETWYKHYVELFGLPTLSAARKPVPSDMLLLLQRAQELLDDTVQED